MNSSSPLDAKEQIRQAINLVDLVGEQIELRRQGNNFVGRCPWHDDSRPSLQVNPERQTWRCWVCDIGGDLFSFVMKRESLGFRETLEMLGERAGVALTPQRGTASLQGASDDKRTLLAACAWAEEQFHRSLLSTPEGAPARAYLADREISRDSVARFRLGFAPDRWDWLLDAARNAGFSPEVLERVGLIRSRKENAGWYDFFRGRVIFPLCDLQSRPIAFGGRILPEFSDRGGGKYVNSPETPLYSKNKELYALNHARDAVQAAKQVVVMEGYTDVIMAHQHSVENVVAVCGTALGDQHLRLIQRFTDSIALVLDGDEAGQRRSNEVLEFFVANPIDLRILTLPDGLDPCDFIASPKEGRGPRAFAELLARAPDALEHKINVVTNGLDAAKQTHAVSQAAEQVLATLARAPVESSAASSALLREQGVLGRLARRLRLPEEPLRRRLNALRRKPTRQAFSSSDKADLAPKDDIKKPLTAYERELLEAMLVDSAAAHRVLDHLGERDLDTTLGRELFSVCRESFEQHGAVDFRWIMNALEAPGLKSQLVRLDENTQAKSQGDLDQRVEDLLTYHKKRRQDSERAGQRAALQSQSLDDNQESETLKELFDALKNRQTGSLSTDG